MTQSLNYSSSQSFVDFVISMLAAAVPFLLQTVSAAKETPIVGAIRWDAYFSQPGMAEFEVSHPRQPIAANAK
jgi:hypothetical protein